MERHEFERHVEDVKQRAHGRWSQILTCLGVDAKILNRRNQPCPLCGGTDRFQYTDKYGEGNYYCRKCGPGGGLKLLQAIFGWEFGLALRKVEECVGSNLAQQQSAYATAPSSERMKALAKRLWDEARPIQSGDPVDAYLRRRGLGFSGYPLALRCHSGLGYYEKLESGRSRKVGNCAAMLACVQGSDGVAVTLHRTYVRSGQKAFGPSSRKVLSAGIERAAIRLFEPTEVLAIAEGIETALAVHLATGKPVWAAMSAGNMEKLWIPDSVHRVDIYADNDVEFTGQAAAFNLAHRLMRQARVAARQVEVFVPKTPGADWADVWLSRQGHEQHAA